MSNKNSSKKFTTLLRSTFAFSLATMGIVSAPLLKNTVLHCRLPLAELIAHADETPDLSSIYYDDDTNMFTSRDKSWSVQVNGRIYSLLINHLGSYRSVTPDTEGVMLFKLDSPPVNASYTLSVGDQVINTGAIHPINLNGHTYYGATLSKTIIQKLVHEVVRTKTSGRITFTNIHGVLPISDFPMDVNTTLNVSLPAAEYYTDDQTLADHVAGLKLSLTDSDGKVVDRVPIEKDWIETKKDSNLPGTYQYTLNNLGIQALRKKLSDMGGDYWVYHQHYTLGDVGTGKVTVLPKNPTEVTATVSYVDATTGKTVSTDKIRGFINDVGIYQVRLPKGYQLATGQLQKIKYRLAASRSDNLTVKVIPASDDSSDSGDNSSSGDDHSSSDNGSSGDDHSSSDNGSSGDDHSSSDNGSSGDDHSSSDNGSSGDDHSSKDNSSSGDDHSSKDNGSGKDDHQSDHSDEPGSASSSNGKASSNNSADSSSSAASHHHSSNHSDHQGSSRKPSHGTSSSSHKTASASPKRGTVTIAFVDGNGHVVDQQIYSGWQNTRVPFELSDHILGFLRHGYDLVSPGTPLSQLKFGAGNATYQVGLQKRDTPIFTNALAASKSADQSTANQQPAKKANQRSHSKNSDHPVLVEELTQQSRLQENLAKQHFSAKYNLVDPRLQSPLAPPDDAANNFFSGSHGGGGGGNGDEIDPDLGAFFTALAGKVNFTQQT
ncbi:hypothetical protein GBO93_07785 [Pediococcus acidilactici]|uniref:hypothetical protein n=1 Tax=Pediococcus acidilactici TaxID=1254 RepID=UPI0013271FDD|nr:hypothetical protein [Pediococcus acidilactici]KAF0334253.1 hypothetical protein GBO20_08335 [Pediococcus acidilactici]KAF0337230.1 hypothetical protein GBO39_06820 [Pediococcus acidilactici]KAF0338872.1 hypothetical protein GBO40_08145 [Pediococcus acidilactici]KAF0343754.1 hypothetical protein GBO43_08825 [Pediococcus acidilactici]KAF0349120.1 hypothetical protein GBO45_06040 [Pediococcus acidilactici]